MPPPPPRYAAAGASAAVYSAGDRGGFGAAASAAASTSERARDPYSSVFPKVPVDAEAAGSFFAEADSAFASLFSGLKASASGVKKANSSSGVSSSGGFARGAPAAAKARPAAGGSGRPPSPPSEDSEEESEVSSAARARATRAANEALLASAAAGLPKTFDWDEGIPDFPDILPVSSASVPFPPPPSAVHAGAGAGSRRPPSPKLFGAAREVERDAAFRAGSRTAGQANASHLERGYKPPYAEEHHARVICLERARVFVRVHTDGYQVSKWVMRLEDIEGLSEKQIQEKFAIPELPTHISEVNLPAGVYLQIGVAAPQDEWGKGGGIQYEILSEMKKGWFSKPALIHEYHVLLQSKPLKR